MPKKNLQAKNLLPLKIPFASYAGWLVLKDFPRVERVKDANRVKNETIAYALKI